MAAFAYKSRTELDVRLRRFEQAVKTDAYESVLNAISDGIRKAVGRIHPDDEDAANETEIIENMLGTAFVVCQAQANAILQAAHQILNQTMRKPDIRKLGPLFDNTAYSKVEVLWELANYFKHRDEWTPGTWSNPANHTVGPITAAGLNLGSASCNLRTGAEALGNGSYTEVESFNGIVRDWSEKVRDQIKIQTGR